LYFIVLADGTTHPIPPEIPPNMALYEYPGARLEARLCRCVSEKRLQKRLVQLMDGGAVPRIYRQLSFESWDAQPEPDRAGKQEARACCEQFATGKLVVDGAERFGLVLSGTVGRGKTGLASCVLIERARRGESVLWVEFSKFIRKVRDTYREGAETSYEQVVGAAAQVPFLLIDDMGDMDAARGISDDVRRNVYDVISERYNALRHTLITTNLDANQFRKAYGDRIADRVLYLYHWQTLGGVNLRFNGD
jgi:DNA replication protein DnaC